MRQAIITKYIGPTNFKGSRIKATTASGISKVTEYDDALNSEQNHMQAASNLMDKLSWDGKLVGGSTPTGYCFVIVD